MELTIHQPIRKLALGPFATPILQRAEVHLQAKLFLDLPRGLLRGLAKPPVPGGRGVPAPGKRVLPQGPLLQHNLSSAPTQDPAVKGAVPVAVEVYGRTRPGAPGGVPLRVIDLEQFAGIVLLH